MLSATRDMAAAQRFFRKTLAVAEEAPQQVTTDGHDSYPRAIREVLGSNVEHRNNAYLNRRIEQDHRGIKQRYYPTLGFGAFRSAQRFCRAKKSDNTFVRAGNENSLSPSRVVGSSSSRKCVCCRHSLLPLSTTTQRGNHDPRRPCSFVTASPDTFKSFSPTGRTTSKTAGLMPNCSTTSIGTGRASSTRFCAQCNGNFLTFRFRKACILSISGKT